MGKNKKRAKAESDEVSQVVALPKQPPIEIPGLGKVARKVKALYACTLAVSFSLS